MTQTEEEITKIVVEGFIIIVAGWDLIFTKEERWYKRISKAGWLLIILALGDIGISIAKFSTESADKLKEGREAKKDHQSDVDDLKNTVNEAFKKHKASINLATKTVYISDTIKTVDTSSRIINPVMDVSLEADSNPRIIGKLDSLRFRIEFGCINSGIAYNIRDKLVAFSVKNSKFTFSGSTNRAVLESTETSGNRGQFIETQMSINKFSPFKDTMYIYFKLKYSNKPINGQDQEPLRKIYYFIENPFVSSTKDLSKVKEVENEDKYMFIKNVLIVNKLW